VYEFNITDFIKLILSTHQELLKRVFGGPSHTALRSSMITGYSRSDVSSFPMAPFIA
jgi:hypothetical protein